MHLYPPVSFHQQYCTFPDNFYRRTYVPLAKSKLFVADGIILSVKFEVGSEINFL